MGWLGEGVGAGETGWGNWGEGEGWTGEVGEVW
jgi:hypothetical protein